MPADVSSITLDQQAAECEREMKMRERVYARWQADGKMTASAAETGIARMKAAAATLRKLADAEKAKVEIRGVHDLRHTWASWRYALEPDLLRLRDAGGWASVDQVEVYAHLLPAGHEVGIRRVWGIVGALVGRASA